MGNQKLRVMCKKTGIDTNIAVQRLKNKNITADPEQTLKDTAEVHDFNPVDIMKIIPVTNKQ